MHKKSSLQFSTQFCLSLSNLDVLFSQLAIHTAFVLAALTLENALLPGRAHCAMFPRIPCRGQVSIGTDRAAVALRSLHEPGRGRVIASGAVVAGGLLAWIGNNSIRLMLSLAAHIQFTRRFTCLILVRFWRALFAVALIRRTVGGIRTPCLTRHARDRLIRLGGTYAVLASTAEVALGLGSGTKCRAVFARATAFAPVADTGSDGDLPQLVPVTPSSTRDTPCLRLGVLITAHLTSGARGSAETGVRADLALDARATHELIAWVAR